MTNLYYDDDADLAVLSDKTVAIIGYGSQGHAHALSLRDSGVDVVVGLKESSSSRAKAQEQGLKVATVAKAAASADIVMMLVPDQHQADVYTTDVAPNLQPGNAVFFSHGFNIRFDYIQPAADIDVAMVAPKGPGHVVRREFEAGRGVPALVAVEQIPPAAPRSSPWHTPRGSAPPAPESSRPPSPKRPDRPLR